MQRIPNLRAFVGIAALYVRYNKMTKNKIICIIFVLIINFLVIKEVYVSQIHLLDISLDEVVQDSSCIVIARKADPFVTEEKINITPFWKRLFGKKYPPFTKTTYHFVVIDVLFSKGKISENKLINVIPASQESYFVMHKCYYLEDVVPSPSVRSYKTNINLEKSDKLILFLTTSDYDNFTFTVENAYEDFNKKKEIENIIRKKNK